VTGFSATVRQAFHTQHERISATAGHSCTAPSEIGISFAYEIKGDRPEWRPLRAFDDGTQVFIEFPPSIAVGEAPPLFVIGEEGKAELVNFRMRGRYYIVDRLFTTAELRLGEKHQSVVRIMRTDTAHKGRRG
jgi:P-type conjugative transfer protein TrbG